MRKISDSAHVFPLARVIGPVSIGDRSILDDLCFIYATEECPVTIGRYVHVSAFASISGGPAILSDYCNLGAGSRLVAGSDDFFGGALAGAAIPARFRKVTRELITLGKHSIVSTNCVILPGVTIGEGACVGANSLVKEDVPPWTIVAGSPARFIRHRPSSTVLALASELENE